MINDFVIILIITILYVVCVVLCMLVIVLIFVTITIDIMMHNFMVHHFVHWFNLMMFDFVMRHFWLVVYRLMKVCWMIVVLNDFVMDVLLLIITFFFVVSVPH